MDDIYYMKEALKEAQAAFEADEVPIGAVVVCNDRIIVRTYNFTEHLHDVTAHAEMQAVTAASEYLGGKYLVNCTIYITLEPCVMCAGALSWAQIGKVVYGAKDEKRGYSQYSNAIFHPKTTVISGVLEDECAELLRKFFKKKR